MAQATAQPEESEIKTSEDKPDEETPSEIDQKTLELQTVRFDWPGLQVGPGIQVGAAVQVGAGPEVMVYSPNQRSRPGEIPQGLQPVPAIWMAPPRGAPWQYSGLTDHSLANGQASSGLGWQGAKHIFACSVLVVLLLMLMRYIERYWPLLRFRARRARPRSALQVTCHVRTSEEIQSPTDMTSESGDEAFDIREKPPSYFEYPEPTTDTTPKKEKSKTEETRVASAHAPPYSCVFSSTKGKVPRLHIFDTRRDRKLMQKMGFAKHISGQSSGTRRMTFNVPTAANATSDKKQHIVIQVNDPERDSGCVIGLDVRVDKGHDGGENLEKREFPLDVIVGDLKLDDEKN